ncbi:MAG: AcrR family transcriptional regulator [Phenylobacterium sp.]|jgi:AcrR family transcriptional regulator
MNSKKLTLVQSALKLFYSKGIHAVGINEILKHSGVAKKTLYNHFASKDDLILEALQYRDDIFIQWFDDKLNEVAPGRDALIALFYALDEWFNNRSTVIGNFRGCFFINASAEYGDTESMIFLACKKHKNRVRNIIKRHVDLFEPDESQSNLLADTLCILKEGAITTAKVQYQLDAALKVIPLVSKMLSPQE